MKTARYLPLLLCFCIGQALADTPINLHHDASANARVSISNVAGTVNVIAWDRNEVQVSGRLGEGAKPLAITGSKDHLEIKVEPKGSSGGWFNWGGDNNMSATTLELHVPRAASLEVDVISAPLVIDGMDGGSIEVNTVSGKARINARTPSLTVDSVSGGIEQAGHADKVELQTVSGDILAPSLGNQVELQTISGRIQASGGPWQKLTLSTVSGNVQLNGGLTAGGSINIDSMSGDVQLQVPASTDASLHATSFSGNLRSDFGTATQPEHGPGSSLDARLGNGQGKINVETFSGDLRVRRQD
ncbi:Putative adhesin domain-containing protein [Rhodanobacter sp. Root179]|uniref:DUF4097 family beta strand repeat-containing protein n=1 Tax=Rhodanobacter sp. Root179 TaxID=1736482 RepID=UPI0006FAE524|nr:DUF4097 family beta strand repeat-containing protein [Rhodanobacter sp. Root179]KRB48714.1 hypothetical protein ASD82_04880 [Rhodanobacter sp. Root179]